MISGRPYYPHDSYETSYILDRKRGVRAERRFWELMRTEHDITLKPTDRYCFYDFADETNNVLIELKRRNIAHNKYKTTLLAYDKIERFEQYNRQNGGKYRFIMVFYYNDGIYYFVHSTGYPYQIDKFKRQDRNDPRDRRKDYVFIPITELKPIDSIRSDIQSKLIVVYNT